MFIESFVKFSRNTIDDLLIDPAIEEAHLCKHRRIIRNATVDPEGKQSGQLLVTVKRRSQVSTTGCVCILVKVSTTDHAFADITSVDVDLVAQVSIQNLNVQ